MSIAERVCEVRAWANSRIRECREQEDKFARSWQIGKGHGPPDALVEAWTERRALEAVLRMLDGDDNDDPQSKALRLRSNQEPR